MIQTGCLVLAVFLFCFVLTKRWKKCTLCYHSSCCVNMGEWDLKMTQTKVSRNSRFYLEHQKIYTLEC